MYIHHTLLAVYSSLVSVIFQIFCCTGSAAAAAAASAPATRHCVSKLDTEKRRVLYRAVQTKKHSRYQTPGNAQQLYAYMVVISILHIIPHMLAPQAELSPVPIDCSVLLFKAVCNTEVFTLMAPGVRGVLTIDS